MSISALFTTAIIWKQPKYLDTDDQMEKICMVYEYNEILFSLIIKEGNSFFWDIVDRLGRHFARWNESVNKDKFCVIPHTLGIKNCSKYRSQQQKDGC